MLTSNQLLNLLEEVRSCTHCAQHLPLGPKPLLAAHPDTRILLIGQAPGKATHLAGIPWQDRSGDRLRTWLGVSRDQFYDPRNIALVPTGFCYPGSSSKSDLPPRPECAPLWQGKILPLLTKKKLTIYIGSFAFTAALGARFKDLSEAVEAFEDLLPNALVLPHPSPRNGMWVRQRPWFTSKVLPALQKRVAAALKP